MQMHTYVLDLRWFSQLLAEICNLEVKGRCYVNAFIFNGSVVLFISVGGFAG